MAQISGKKPKNLKKTFQNLLSYMGRHKILLLIVAVLVSISAGRIFWEPICSSL